MLNKDFLNKLLSNGTGLTGASGTGSSINDLLKGRAGAAVAGGALGYLLGSKKGRQLGGKVLTYGGLAALGVLAYKAYGNWQQQQGNQPASSTAAGLHTESGCRAILVCLIAAAKADGHIDERERQLIEQEISRLTTDAGIRQFVDAELKKPLDPAAVARLATSEQLAAEMYMATLLVIDEESFMERSYLTELARQLKLPESLQLELRQQVKAAGQLVAG